MIILTVKLFWLTIKITSFVNKLKVQHDCVNSQTTLVEY